MRFLRVSQGAGGFGGQLDPGDLFGEAVATVGDLDGDGVEDFVVAGGADDDGGLNRGAIWVLFLNSDGTVRTHQKISDTQGGFTGVLDDSDRFGVSVCSLGDVDGNGVVDIAVGAVGDDDGGTDRGAVWILFLRSDGTVVSSQKISDIAGNFNGILDNGDGFGFAASGLGDLDEDGVPDLAVGAPRDDDGSTDAGAVWILFLNPNGTVRVEQKISDTAGNFGGVLDPSDVFGFATAPLGDLDGDGVQDLAAGAYLDDDGGTDRGAVWILLLNTNGTVKTEQKISDTAGNFGGVLDNSDFFGNAVGNIGDLDGDGLAELAVGANIDDDGGPDLGAVWLLFLNPNGTVRSDRKISQTSGGFEGRLCRAGSFGRAVALVGDVDNDGRPEIGIGSHFFGDQAYPGDTWILSLNDCSIPPTITQPPASVLLGFMGGVTQFSVTADGSPTLSHQWRHDGVNLVNSANFLGVSTPTLTVVAFDAQIGSYDCVVSNAFGSATSAAAVLGLRAPCPADFNRDGVANSQDFFNFMTAFFAGCP